MCAKENVQIKMSVAHWPEDLNPNNCSSYTISELTIDASSSRVWSWYPILEVLMCFFFRLIRAPLWSSFYDNCKSLQIFEVIILKFENDL